MSQETLDEIKSLEDQMEEIEEEDLPVSAKLSKQYRTIQEDILHSVINKAKLSGVKFESEEQVRQNMEYLASNIEGIMHNKLMFEVLSVSGIDDLTSIFDEDFVDSLKNGFRF
jgi:predicted transcriptional regulator